MPIDMGVSVSVFRCFSNFDRYVWPIKIFKIWRCFKKDRAEHSGELNHAHTLMVNGSIAYLAKKRWGTPYVVTIRNTDVNYFLKRSVVFRYIGMKIMKDSAAILTLSHAYWNVQVRTLFSQHQIKMVEAKHFTIPNGCDDFWFENRSKRKAISGDLELLFVGRLDRNKNLDMLLTACEGLGRRGVSYQLTVVGDGPLEAEVKRRAAGSPVTFVGFICNPKVLMDYYRRAHILIVPSKTESFGVVYAEAISQGVPVIYTKGQGFDGFFENGVVGFAVDSSNPDEIAARILDIKADYACFSARALEASTRFRWDGPVEELNQIYSQSCETSIDITSEGTVVGGHG